MPLNTQAPVRQPQSAGRRRRIQPLAAGLVVVLLLGGVAIAVRAAGGSGEDAGVRLPELRLMSTAGAAVSVDAPTADRARGRYLLAGSLPSSRPPAAPIYQIRAGAQATLVGRLAGALGLPGKASKTGAGWQLSSKGGQLLTLDGGTGAWRLAPGTVSVDGRLQCFRAPCPNETGPYGNVVGGQPAPPPSVAKQVASDALRLLGLPVKDLTTSTNGQLTEVRAARPVEHTPAYGFDTVLAVGIDRTIRGGHGWLGQPARGPAYPLVTAAEAFRRLQAQPYAQIALCRLHPAGGCAPAPQTKVTGAELGLMTALDARGALLVPAWLFSVAGQADPVPVVAVESRYLRPADPRRLGPSAPTASTPGPGQPPTRGSLPPGVSSHR